ncbi:MAG: GDYXXLXY domain-containing protein, partial [Hyphomicrobiaceae bacterium]|nr:GDYXXLXY domain-containing protein [Hyphomicrobiaceae bacterium]
FIRLAPVDPRSLMRGDYMALNYAYPLHLVSHKKNAATPVRAYADIGPQGVAEIRQFAGKNAKAVRGSQLLKVRFQFRRLIIGTNAYFFQEGTGPKYRRAKYGVFRVTPNGDAILTGLADERLEVIK